MKNWSLIAGFTMLALAAASSPAQAGSCSSTVAHAHSGDIVDIAASNDSFSTLVTAVQAAGLVDVLKGEGPFTVFAPTNEAFAKLPPGTLQTLLNDKEALTRVLTYHVVPGRVMAADVMSLTSAKTVQGQSIQIDTSSGVRINEATVVATDIEASNGVIHVIDTVIVPAAEVASK